MFTVYLSIHQFSESTMVGQCQPHCKIFPGYTHFGIHYHFVSSFFLETFNVFQCYVVTTIKVMNRGYVNLWF